MDVSIVIVSFNVAHFLNDCLLSIKQETRRPHEIIVVDNNSTDDSVDIVRTYHSNVTLIQSPRNIGFARANNLAFRQARGRYIFMLNPDTLVLDRAIDKLAQFMDEHPEVSACGPKNLNSDLSLQYNCHHFPSLFTTIFEYLQLKRYFPRNRLFGRGHMTYWNYDTIKKVDWITGCSLMIQKKILENTGYLDENYFIYAEECDFCFRLKKNNLETVFYPYASIIHHGGQSSLELSRPDAPVSPATKYLFESRYYFYRKNYGTAREFILRMLDSLYFGIVLFKNKIMRTKKFRHIRITQAKIAIQAALTHL